MTVTAIITTYNRAHWVRESIDSVLHQTRLVDEIIVVNDGSTDNTQQILSRYRDRIAILEQANAGRPSALNLALHHTHTDYVWFFDDDDIALPSAIEQHLHFLARNPDCDFTYSPHYFFAGEFDQAKLQVQRTPRFPYLSSSEFLIWTLEDMHNKLQGMLIGLRCLHAVGWFDEALHRSQDHDMVIRLARRFRAGCVNTPTCGVRVHGGARGPGFAQHGQHQRAGVWRHYQKLIYQRVRNELALNEYLPNDYDNNNSLACEEQRQALLQRAYVMANHGLYDEALADLQASKLQCSKADNALSTAEQRLFSMTTFVDDTENIPPMGFYLSLGRSMIRYSGAFKLYSRGLYWSVAHNKKHPWVLLRVGMLALGYCLGSIVGLMALPLCRTKLNAS